MRTRSLTATLTVATCLALRAAQPEPEASPASAHSQKRVLTLYALRQGNLVYTITERIYVKALRDALGDQLDYYSELLDVYRFGEASYQTDFEDYLVRKYNDRAIDLLIANGPAETDVAVRLQARLASHPPIVFNDIEAPPVRNSTGHFYGFAMKESFDLALRVHPDTRHAFVVCGASAVDAWYEKEFRRQVPTPAVDITYLCGFSVADITEQLAALPQHSIVFLTSFSGDREGRQLLTADVTERLAAASNAPIYTWNGNYPGPFGGRLLSTDAVASTTIRIALRVLRGERPEDIPVTASTVSFDTLDWRQLDRWGLSEARVPPGVELKFREPSVFERYRIYILGAVGLLVSQTVLIAALLIQRRNRRLAEGSLRESEQRFRVMADTAPVMVWRSGSDQQCDFFNKPWLDFTGRDLRDELGDGWADGVHPEDIDRCLAVYRGAWSGRQSFRMEYRLRRADGQYRWVLDTGVPRLSPDGALLGYIGSCLDITERRQAEESLRANETALRHSHAEVQDLAGRLITAQEEERARIARELHDDFSQQLAGISMAISACKRRPETRENADLRDALTAAQRQTIALADDIRLLSHDLHPGVLRHAGLVDALRSHCCEFARQQSIDVEVDADPDLAVADIETTLCLYRIAQEALRNVAKHAGARQVHLTVRRFEDEVQLSVTDDGKGFDLSKARERGGLGLRSIDERVRLVGGRLSIESSSSTGTAITVWVKAAAPTVHALA